MMSEIWKRGPITCRIAVADDLFDYTGGVYNDKTGEQQIRCRRRRRLTTHARTQARTHVRTHARTHARTHKGVRRHAVEVLGFGVAADGTKYWIARNSECNPQPSPAHPPQATSHTQPAHPSLNPGARARAHTETLA